MESKKVLTSMGRHYTVFINGDVLDHDGKKMIEQSRKNYKSVNYRLYIRVSGSIVTRFWNKQRVIAEFFIDNPNKYTTTRLKVKDKGVCVDNIVWVAPMHNTKKSGSGWHGGEINVVKKRVGLYGRDLTPKNPKYDHNFKLIK